MASFCPPDKVLHHIMGEGDMDMIIRNTSKVIFSRAPVLD